MTNFADVSPRSRISGRVVVFSLVAALCVVYVAGALVFSRILYPDTVVLGVKDVSLMPTSSVADAVDEVMSELSVHVSGQGLDFDVDAVDVDLRVHDRPTFVTHLGLGRNPWLWFVEMWGEHELLPDGLDVAGVNLDADALRSRVDGFVSEFNEGAQAPTNASVVRDGDKPSFVISEESVGTMLDSDLVCERVMSSVRDYDRDARLDESCLLQPEVRSDDAELVSSKDTANHMVRCNIPLLVDGSEVAKVPSERIAEWVVFDGEGVNVDVDAATAWFKGEFSKSYDTVGTQRNYTRPDGSEVEVPAGDGTYGWNVDGAELARQVAGQLVNVNDAAIEVPFHTRGAKFVRGGWDWPSRYVDVDLSAQHVWLYDGSEVVWESECVSGNTSNGHGTPSGVFFVEYKASPMVLVGADENHDGEPDYRTPVDYWMPFYDGCGLHDATWRSSFGGSIYSSDGSHGCVNLPYGKAQELYGLLSEGDVVVVHW